MRGVIAIVIIKNMVKTIFDLAGGKKEKETIEFDDSKGCEGKWFKTGVNSSLFKHCILISKDSIYEYYVCWDDNDKIRDTMIFRRKHGKSD